MAFWSADPDFGSGVEGPVQLVSSLGAVTDGVLEDVTGGVERVAFRCWPGVPSGVFIDDTLYVYYSCRPNVDPDDPSVAYRDEVTNLDAAIAAYQGGQGMRGGWTYVAKFPPSLGARNLVGRSSI